MNEGKIFGERIQTPSGKPIIKRKAGVEKPVVEKEEKNKEIQKFDVIVDKNEKMVVLPLKGNNAEEQDEAQKILAALEKEKQEFYKKRAAEGFNSHNRN